MAEVKNKQIELAYQYVQSTNQNIFLTGKAGTGKTTFLRRVRQETIKRTAVVAPTGIAAINAGGMTIHSLFQLPFGMFVPNGQPSKEQRKFSRKKISLIRSLDLLIIDEISMVRADLLDAVDDVLRRVRRSKAPFGGVQLLMIGDLHQLPPVVKQEEWYTLREYYKTPYFFGSLALQRTAPVTIQLTHIYRQSDSVFIDLLNKVRNNQLDKQVLDQLNSRYIPNFVAPEEESYIILTSHNKTAQKINDEKLEELDTKTYAYKAEVEGNFSENNFPTKEKLALKKGSQVMFIKNDLSFEKRYYNGKIGRITSLDRDNIYVKCPDDELEISVNIEEWLNVKYKLNEKTKEVEEGVVGSFRQFPLKLAWAITIHKSQGLTFERAIIDANAAFAHGQVYVALSRCKSFEGIVLRTKIDYSSVKTDAEVRKYSTQADKNAPNEEHLIAARKEYQQKLILELFNFQLISFATDDLLRIYMEHERILTTAALEQVKTAHQSIKQKLGNVAQKFENQIKFYCTQNWLPEENELLQERLKKGSTYFLEQIENTVQPQIKEINVLTDNQAVKQRIEGVMERLELQLFIKMATLKTLKPDFDAQNYLTAKTDAALDFATKKNEDEAPQKVYKIPAGVEHPELYKQLTYWRHVQAKDRDVRTYDILPSRSLVELVKRLPTDKKNLKKVKGIGPVKLEQFGTEIIEIIDDYCTKHNLESNRAGKLTKADTKQITYDLFKSGKSIDQITLERSLTAATIYKHLSHFVKSGELSAHDILDKSMVRDMEDYFESHESGNLTQAYQHFEERYSYDALRLALTSWKVAQGFES
ncbi:MAG: helix-turn-helix domain-containing protein [Bacteroidota bacterium]